jgi:hypothetical protein
LHEVFQLLDFKGRTLGRHPTSSDPNPTTTSATPASAASDTSTTTANPATHGAAQAAADFHGKDSSRLCPKEEKNGNEFLITTTAPDAYNQIKTCSGNNTKDDSGMQRGARE